MLEACLPFGPCTTSKLTRWPSVSDLKPCMLIAEKCANRSSPPSSGVMKPKPLASLNHLTIPVAMCNYPCMHKVNRVVSPSVSSLHAAAGMDDTQPAMQTKHRLYFYP